MLLLPFMSSPQELLSSVLVFCFAFRFQQMLFNHCLSRNPRVVCPWQVTHLVLQHSLPAAERVLDRRGQGVADVQVPSHIRRGQHHHVLWLAFLHVCVFSVEVLVFFPEVIPERLHVLRLIGIKDFLTILFILKDFFF